MPFLSFPLVLEDIYFGIRTADEARMSEDGQLLAYVELQLDRDADDRLSRIVVLAREHDGEDERWAPVASFLGTLPRWSPTDRRLAFVDARHEDGPGLLVWEPTDERPRRLTDASRVEDVVWRPDGGALACVVAPASEPARDPIVIRHVPVHVNGRPLGAGRSSLHVIDARDGSMRKLLERDYDVSSPAWRPTGDGTIAFCGSRTAHIPSHAYLIDEDGGEPRRVSCAEGECEQLTWTPDGRQLVISGKRVARSVGQRQLFVLDPGNGEMRRIAADVDREVDISQYPLWHGSIATVERDGRHVLFTAYDRTEVSLYRAPLDGGPTERLLGERFEAVGTTTLAGEDIVTVVSDPKTAGEVEIVSGRDGSRRRITNVAGDSLARLVVPEAREFTAPDGTTIHGLLLRGADPSAPGPLLLNIHGGPHYAYVPAINEPDLHNWEFAARGWNVLMLNPRGSFGYGEEYYRGVLHGWGEHDFDDFMTALDVLVEEGVADPLRLGLTGHSYGGYMTNYLLVRTDRFRAAVCGAGNCDLADMYGTAAVGIGLIANEMGGRPFEQQERYDRHAPIRDAHRIHTPVLFLHGAEDWTTPLSGAEKIYTTLRDLGRETELVVYPGCDHVYTHWPVSMRLDYDRRLIDWLTRHVLGETP